MYQKNFSLLCIYVVKVTFTKQNKKYCIKYVFSKKKVCQEGNQLSLSSMLFTDLCKMYKLQYNAFLCDYFMMNGIIRFL